MSTSPLVLDNVSKHFGDVRAVDGIDLAVTPGTITGFLGPNGAGKTTTIRVAMGLTKATSGTVLLFGEPAGPATTMSRQRVGYLPGALGMDDKLTGWQVINLLADLRGSVRRSDIDELVERFRFNPHRRIGTYSSGMRRKLGLVQAFMHRPDLLVMDEPTSGLDPLMRRELFAVMREAVQRDGATIFMSSHVLSEVEHVADEVAMIRRGKIVVSDSVASLKLRAPRILELHFGDRVDPETFSQVGGVEDVRVHGLVLTCRVTGSVDSLVKLAAQHTVISIVSHEPDIESIFLGAYRESDAGGTQ